MPSSDGPLLRSNAQPSHYTINSYESHHGHRAFCSIFKTYLLSLLLCLLFREFSVLLSCDNCLLTIPVGFSVHVKDGVSMKIT